MLTCESVRSTDSPHFAMLDALYARAFPWHEQRESEAKRQALSHPRYALEAWFDEGVFVGLSGCWQFARLYRTSGDRRHAALPRLW